MDKKLFFIFMQIFLFNNLTAEELIKSYEGYLNDSLGMCVRGVGDLNNDTISDYVITNLGQQRVDFYSGKDHQLLFFVSHPVRYENDVASAGDVDNDGHDDVVIGNPNIGFGTGEIFVYSGRTGLAIHHISGQKMGASFGTVVSGVGDIDHDGHSDFTVAAPNDRPGSGVFPAGKVYVYSGKYGHLLFSITPGKSQKNYSTHFGSSINSAGDVNADGTLDFIIGAPAANYVAVVSGKDGSFIYEKTKQGRSFGVSVDGIGDINGDGYDDFCVGATGEDPFNNTPGLVVIYSGKDGSVIREIKGNQISDNFGFAISSKKDINGDGFKDLLVGAPNAAKGLKQGEISIYSGKNGKKIFSYTDVDAASLGRSVDIIGDITRDRWGEIIFSDPNSGAYNPHGRVYIFSVKPKERSIR